MAGTRQRIVTATTELFRQRGYTGTSLKQVTTAAEAPFGSLYHYFPEGKEELAETVLLSSGRAYQELFEAIYDAAPTPAQAVTDFFDGAAAALEDGDYIDPCPIGTVAREVASTNDRLRLAAATVFTGWQAAATTRLMAAGLDEARADELALTLIAAIEGGFLLSRTVRSVEPMRSAGRNMRHLVEEALDDAGRQRSDPTPAPASGN